jgi:NAD(P)H-flavin reductase
MMLVIKNYNAGLSGKLHDPDNDLLEYEVKGPLGQSLQVQKSGLHIAFTAGTGVLPILDLVAHLLFTTMGLNKAL